MSALQPYLLVGDGSVADGMKALVTGGAGFIGSHMAELLLSEGWEVAVLDDMSSGSYDNLARLSIYPGFSFYRGSVCDADMVKASVCGCSAVFHFAAMVAVPLSIERPEACWSVNVAGFKNVETALHGSGIPLLYASSAAVYGDCGGGTPNMEDGAVAPMSPYAWSKLVNELQAEFAWRVYGVKTIGFRFFNVYGPRQNPNGAYASLIPAVCSRLILGERPVVYGDGGQTRDLIFVKDAVRLMYEALKKCNRCSGMVFNAASGCSCSVLDIVRTIIDISGIQTDIEFLPERPGDIRYSAANTDRLHRYLGNFNLVTIDKGLVETVKWYISGRC